MSTSALLMMSGGTEPESLRPAPVKHAPLPPFDPSDPHEGQVHTTPPPELVIPPGPDNLFMRADFNGVCLDLNRWGIQIDQSHNWLIGANSTPFNMLMTPMYPMYSRQIQDAGLTEHAERNYSHFVVASQYWNMPENGFYLTPAQFTAWCLYLKSWGFFVVYWMSASFNNSYLISAVDAHAIDWVIVGKEIDTSISPEDYANVLANVLAIVGNGIPLAAHFSNNYPEGFPRDTYFDGRSMPGWDFYDGKVHLMWQANCTDPSQKGYTAGGQASMLYYARQRVNLGLVGGNGRPAPNSRVYAFETMATQQLYGSATEEYGCLRSLELLYATRDDPRILPVSGFGNGGRYPDGMWL